MDLRRLYIAPQSVVLEHKDYFHPLIGHHYVCLFDYTDPSNGDLDQNDPAWEALPEVISWRAAGSLVLLSTSLEHKESHLDLWHNHPDVVILPNPVFQGNMTMTACVNSPANKMCETHLDKLACLGITADNTVLDIADKVSSSYPEVRLSSTQ